MEAEPAGAAATEPAVTEPVASEERAPVTLASTKRQRAEVLAPAETKEDLAVALAGGAAPAVSPAAAVEEEAAATPVRVVAPSSLARRTSPPRGAPAPGTPASARGAPNLGSIAAPLAPASKVRGASPDRGPTARRQHRRVVPQPLRPGRVKTRRSSVSTRRRLFARA